MSPNSNKNGPGGPAPHVAAAIDTYRCEELSAAGPAAVKAVAPLARQLVAAARPESPKQARRMLWATSQYLLSAHQQGRPMNTAALLHQQNVKRWLLKERADESNGWKQLALWGLHRVGKAAKAGGWAQDQITLSRSAPAEPYSSEEERSLRQQAAQRHKASRTERQIVVAGSGGCGLPAKEIQSLRPSDLEDLGGGRIAVRIDGRNPRLVPVRAEFTPLILDAAKAARDDDTPFIAAGNSGSRVYAIAGKFTTRDGGGLSLPRARSTWLLAHLRAGTPLAALRKIAGPVSADRLNCLLARAAADLDDEDAAKQGLLP